MSGLGHLAPGLLAKTAEPNVPLWVYLAAGETNDLLYFAFTATGLEEPSEITMSFSEGVRYLSQGSIAWSHGFFMSVIWSARVAGYERLRSQQREAVKQVEMLFQSLLAQSYSVELSQSFGE